MFRIRVPLLALILSVSSPILAASLSGRILDDQGKALAGIHVQLLTASEVRNALTGESGAYAFGQLPAGKYTVAVRELGFEEQRQEISLQSDENLTQDIVVRLELLKEQVVVTATRNEMSTSLLGNSVTVISQEEIERSGASTVLDLLRNVPGIHVMQTGAPGSVSSLYVRGGESDYTKVLLDGIPLNQPGGYVDLSNLTAANVERVEVVRGPQSALYGSDAIAGVIQIFTRRAGEETGRPGLEITLEGGSYSQFAGSGRIHGQNGRVNYSGLFSHWETENSVPNSYFHENTVSANVGVDLMPGSSLTLTGRTERGRSGVPGPTLFGPPDLEEFSRRRDSAFAAVFNQQLTESANQRFMYSESRLHQLSEDPLDSGMFVPTYEGRQAPYPSFDYLYSYVNSTRRRLASYQADLALSSHSLATGVEYEKESGLIGDVRASRRNVGYYVQDHLVVSRRLALTAALRLDDNGSFGLAATPRFSVAWLLRQGSPESFWGMTRPKMNTALGIKEPNLIESFSSNPYFRGNPDLKPERTRSLEAGVEQRLAGNRIRVEVNGFYNYFLNQIDLLTTDPATFAASYFNVGRSQAWGLEQVVEFRSQTPFHISAGYTWLDSRILESAAPYHPVLRAGGRLLRRPTHSGFVTAGYFKPAWSVSTSAYLVGNRADNDFYGLGLTQIAGYSRVDVSGTVRLSRRLEAYAVIHNLLNREYSEALGYPALKFDVRSGLRFAF